MLLVVHHPIYSVSAMIGHDSLGFEIELLLSRCKENKVAFWSKLGRRRQMSNAPFKLHATFMPEAVCGRIICDVCLSAKELLQGESLCSLTHLAKRQLKEPGCKVDYDEHFGPVIVGFDRHA